MPVRCASCGEELLGAVNRCWRCGTTIASRPGDLDLPPVREMPIAGPAGVAAEADPDVGARDSTQDGSAADEVYDAELSEPLKMEQAPGVHAPEPVPFSGRRVGSPFAGSPVAPGMPATREAAGGEPGRSRRLSGQSAAAGGAIAALVLGVLSFASSFFSVGALFLALAGLPVGIWGLFSERRGQAILGMLLCCAALAISGFQAAALLYQLRYGVSPWETPTGF